MSAEDTPNAPNDGRRELWRADSNHVREKLLVGLIALAMMAFAEEAIRVALCTWLFGVTPAVFGLMPTRQLGSGDSLGVVAVALAGIGFVGWHLVRLSFRGLPRRLWILESVGGAQEVATDQIDETACLIVEYDGLLKPVRHYFFVDITEIDAVSRGTIGGGGHQVRVRLRQHRLAKTVARFDTARDGEALVRRLKAERVRIRHLDADLQDS